MHSTTLYRLTYLAAALSFGHHIDHVIRHNAVGWPLTDHINAFTLSLVIYPIIVTGLLLYRAGRVGPGFWALVSGGGAIFVSAVHFGPAAAEPPEMILGGYDPPILGWLAFTWLATFVTVLTITSLYETRVWWQGRQARRTFPGYLGEEVFRPAGGAGGEYQIVYRFDSSAHLRGWLDSGERAAWLARAEGLSLVGLLHEEAETRSVVRCRQRRGHGRLHAIEH